MGRTGKVPVRVWASLRGEVHPASLQITLVPLEGMWVLSAWDYLFPLCIYMHVYTYIHVHLCEKSQLGLGAWSTESTCVSWRQQLQLLG